MIGDIHDNDQDILNEKLKPVAPSKPSATKMAPTT